MSRYTLWDLPSNSLLVDDNDVEVVDQSVRAFVEDNGVDVLDSLLLGIDAKQTSQPVSFSGQDIIIALLRERSTAHP